MVIVERGAVQFTFCVGQTIARHPVALFVSQAVCNIALSEVPVTIAQAKLLVIANWENRAQSVQAVSFETVSQAVIKARGFVSAPPKIVAVLDRCGTRALLCNDKSGAKLLDQEVFGDVRQDSPFVEQESADDRGHIVSKARQCLFDSLLAKAKRLIADVAVAATVTGTFDAFELLAPNLDLTLANKA